MGNASVELHLEVWRDHSDRRKRPIKHTHPPYAPVAESTRLSKLNIFKRCSFFFAKLNAIWKRRKLLLITEGFGGFWLIWGAEKEKGYILGHGCYQFLSRIAL